MRDHWTKIERDIYELPTSSMGASSENLFGEPQTPNWLAS